MYDGNNHYVKGPNEEFIICPTVNDSSLRYERSWTKSITEATPLDLMRAQAYAKAYGGKVYPGECQIIDVSAVNLQRAASRDSVLTVRMGRRDYALGGAILHDRESGAFIGVEILRISFCLLRNVPQVDLIVAGHTDHQGLLDELLAFYPNMTSDSEVTIVRFDVPSE